MKGKTINGFTLQRLLGTGGMAEVWYAENEIGMKAAVKIMSLELSHNAQMKERFLNEAKVMVKLDHPNIRKVFGYGNLDGRPAIIMEYLEGNDLKNKIKRGQRFTQEELVKWWDQLVDALNYTHAQDIVHRDIQPSTIFIDQKGNARLLDFGIAKVADTTSGTQTGSTLGTRIYMSPEQVKDPKRVSTPSDVYSLAVSFVHLLTGKTPYDNTTSSDYDIQVSIVTKPLDLSKVPDEWKGFLTPYLNKEPSQRPPLRHFEAVLPVEEPSPTPEEPASTSEGPAQTSEESEATMVAENPPAPEMATQTDEETAFESVQPSQPSRTSQPVKPSTPPNLAKPSTPTEPAKPSMSPKEDEGVAGKTKKGWWIGIAAAIAALVFLAVLLFRESPDDKAYFSCNEVNDYRQYVYRFGKDGKHYDFAMEIIERYVEDSLQEIQERLDEEQARLQAASPIKGAFSMGLGNRVFFAESNLQYRAYPSSYRFAPNPWDIAGEDNENISSSYSGWIDLFGWGTGDTPTRASDKNDDYKSFIDWGSKIQGGWRTPTKEEWDYVLNKRVTTSEMRFAKGMVESVYGLILLPDDWSVSTYHLNNVNKISVSFVGNVISASTWNSTLSPAGAVFLPTAGSRNGYSYGGYGNGGSRGGYYWSSSLSDGYPFDLEFDDENVKINWSSRIFGYSVRLVRSAEK